MTNPLLASALIPDFNTIKVAHFAPAIAQVLSENRQLVASITEQGCDTWETLACPLEQAGERLSNVWSIVSLHNAVLNTEEVQTLYKALLIDVTAYNTEMGQNEVLFSAYQRLASSESFVALSEAGRASIEHILRDYRLSGVALNHDDKLRYSVLKQKLSELTTKFSQNVLDATQGWTKHIDDVQQLAGLPESALNMFAGLARDKAYSSGYLLTLDVPSYLPVLTYCHNRALRQEMYEAYLTRASDQGPNAGKWDNSANIEEILSVRQELAKLLGFENYAALSIENKMASSVDEVLGFLEGLVEHSSEKAKAEYVELAAFAVAEGEVDDLELWDIPYYSEKLKEQQFGLSQEALRPYFPAPKVLSGMFETASRLFNVRIVENASVASYHEDVKFYEVWRGDQRLAGFFVDLYARKDKRGGAWLASCRIRHTQSDGVLQLPLAFLTCNFTPPIDGGASLLTPDEVRTVFHEFGHCLHYMLTQVEVANVACIRGVPWDAVELPSQLMENWCWQAEVVPMISGHIETGAPLPQEMLRQVQAAKVFQSGMMMVRQLEFSLFDFIVHRDFESGKTNVLALLDDVRNRVSVKKPPAFTRFSHAFAHIFAGGYAAGYYSYKWAEVLAADAFSRFEEDGVFSAEAGLSFRTEILEQGGARDVMAMFVAFRGRKPSIDALLAQAGMKS